MAQKINPTSIKIGQQSPWITTYQTYGKSLFFFSYFHTSYFSHIFLLSSLNNFAFFPNFFFLHNKIYFFVKYDKAINLRFPLIFTYTKNWFFNTPDFKVRFFPISRNLNLASAISFYFKSLVFRKIVFRKILLILINLLSNQLKSSKLVYTKFGVKKVKLKGFKLRLVGRFENSKNQMSKKIEYSEGSLSLLSVNSFNEFFSLNIYSKLGVCNFKVWLFF
uniref:ribosomal protein S3 n=1 Tax=Campylaephora sungminbooi TaxID=1896769 RepID=UPI002E7678BE|nr:ribosomal protein S3 [Campylaephora sungminbooi]WQF69643.1 ribosomal protein S3 [Campylaephora sungminbooi]